MKQDDGTIEHHKSNNEATGDSTPVPSVQTGETKHRTPKGESQSENGTQCQKSRWERFKDWLFTITVAEAGMLLLTLVIAGSGITYTVYAHRQWRTMRDQLNSSDSSFQKTLAQMQAQTTAQQNGADASIKSSRETERFFRTDEQARIGVVAMSAVVDPNGPFPIQVEVRFTNSGKTEGLGTISRAAGFVSPQILTSIPGDERSYKTHSGPETAFPNSGNSAIWKARPGFKGLSGFMGGNEYLYIIGDVEYTDVFHLPHKTEFCGYTRREDKTFTYCLMHNASE